VVKDWAEPKFLDAALAGQKESVAVAQ